MTSEVSQGSRVEATRHDQSPTIEEQFAALAVYVAAHGPTALTELRAARRNVASQRGRFLEEADRIDHSIDFITSVQGLLNTKVGRAAVQAALESERQAAEVS